MTLKIDIEELNKELAERQIECLSPEYLGSMEKHKFKCLRCNLVWDSLYHNIKAGHGCPKCSKVDGGKKQRLKITIEEINEKLKDRNILCLSDEYTISSKKYIFHCLVCENIWEADFANIYFSGQGCPPCGEKRTAQKQLSDINISDLNKKLIKRNLMCLDDEYIGKQKLYNWKCLGCGRIFRTSFHSVVDYGTGCRKCSFDNISNENHYRWRGGFSEKDYPKEWFTGKIQIFIRNRDNHICQYPDCAYDDIAEMRKLDVHHIDGNKQNCENWNLISLCNRHHTKIEHNPESWQNYFYAITDSFEYA